jgi:hypothetical protein
VQRINIYFKRLSHILQPIPKRVHFNCLSYNLPNSNILQRISFHINHLPHNLQSLIELKLQQLYNLIHNSNQRHSNQHLQPLLQHHYRFSEPDLAYRLSNTTGLWW